MTATKTNRKTTKTAKTTGKQARKSRFQKGSGVYKCASCGKKTRSTGRGDNENVGLCEECYDRAGDENAVLDGTMTQAEFDSRWNNKAKFAEIKAASARNKYLRVAAKEVGMSEKATEAMVKAVGTKATDKTPKRSLKTPAPAKVTAYAGSPIPATKVFNRRMSEFTNTVAHCWLILDESAGTYTFANTYKDGVLPASYRAESYTYDLTDRSRKVLDKKMELFTEIDVDEWPSFITSAPAKRGRKAGK